MKLRNLVIAAAFSTGAFSGSVSAIQITNNDGTFNFTGFDWAQGGTAFANNFSTAANTNFDLTYFSWATTLQDGVTTFAPSGMDINANGIADAGKSYEYTIVANIQEQVVGCVGTSCTFNVLGGTFDVYYDTTVDADATAGGLGTGFGDGTSIISGTINPLNGVAFDTVQGFNVTALSGNVTSTDLAFIDPALATTNAVTTLQIGNFVTSWVDPGGFNNVAWGGAFGDPVFQADGNQSFNAVTEPASLALLGLGLLGLGWSRRSQKEVV